MGGIREQENIEELKKRLYDRGSESAQIDRHRLSSESIEVARGWVGVNDILPPQKSTQSVPVDPNHAPASLEPANTSGDSSPTVMKSDKSPLRSKLRWWLLGLSLVIFILAVGISSVYVLFGGNQISSNNVGLTLSAPESIAGGEVATIKLGLTNQNSVPIESVTLVVNYPPGSKSAEGHGREIFEERIPLAKLDPGAAVSHTLRAVLFGEENEVKEIKAVVEYRVANSNALLFKEAETQKVIINSSPLVLRVEAVDRVSSGQEMDIKLILKSNAAAPQRNILLNVSFPDSFTFKSADPAPAYGQTSWLVNELLPEATYEIRLVGMVVGQTNEAGDIQLQAGNPRTDNQFMMGSVLTQTKLSYLIDQSFIDVLTGINDNRNKEVVLRPNEEAKVVLEVKNTLAESLYDVRVEISPRGNQIRRERLLINGSGILDTATGNIRFDSSSQRDLSEIRPGETRQFSFVVTPDTRQTTGAFSVSSNVFGRRSKAEDSAEVLVGASTAEVKYSSVVELLREVGYNSGPFTDEGAVPPVSGLPTTYTITWRVSAGANDFTGGSVTANLPQSVSWLDKVAGDGSVTVDAASKQLVWTVGDVSSWQSKTVQFQLELLPTSAQVGRTALVLGMSEFRATDRFTGVALRTTADELTTNLSPEAGFIEGNGVIQPPLE